MERIAQTDLTSLYQIMVNNDLVEPHPHLPVLEPTDEFKQKRQRLHTEVVSEQSEISQADLTAILTDLDLETWTTSDENNLEQNVFVDLHAIERFCGDLSRTELVQISQYLRRFDALEPLDGVPDGFVSLLGTEIDRFLHDTPHCVLYFWKMDCAPCDVVKEDLSRCAENDDIHEDIGFAAINGTNCFDLIYEEYDIAVAPTIAFCHGGEIDSRLTGAIHLDVVQEEISIVTEYITEG